MKHLIAVSCLLVVLGGVARAEDDGLAPPTRTAPKKGRGTLTYTQKIRQPGSPDATVIVSVSPQGQVQVRMENMTQPNEGEPVSREAEPLGRISNGSFSYQLTPEELAAFDAAYASADLTKTPEEVRPGDALGPFTLREQFDSGWGSFSHGIAQGMLFEHTKLIPLIKLFVKTPTDGRIDANKDLEQGAITLHHGGPVGADGTPWRLEMHVAPDGTVKGRYDNVGGAPSGRFSGEFEGKLTPAEIADLRAALANARFVNQPNTGGKNDNEFLLMTTAGGQSRWVAGALKDYPDFLPIVKRLAEVGGRIDRESQPALTPGMNRLIGDIGDTVKQRR